MKLYRTRIPEIAKKVIEELVKEGSIEVLAENRAEAELDLVAVMEEYLRRDSHLRESVRETMSRRGIPYDKYSKVRAEVAGEMGHPTGNEVEGFMISRIVEEVYGEDRELMKRIRGIIETFDVDERAIREEAREKVKNIPEGTVDYEIALNRAIKEVKKRHGLLVERPR
jgi:hypothetical protein